jgi:hypothetical protein
MQMPRTGRHDMRNIWQVYQLITICLLRISGIDALNGLFLAKSVMALVPHLFQLEKEAGPILLDL